MTDLDLYAPATHNGGPPIIDPTDAFKKIDDLYSEAKNFADGEPIESAEMAEAITTLFDGLHEAGKEADALRVAEKAPLDKQVDAIQARYNVYVQPKKGRVALGKDALGSLLAVWRKKVADELAIKAEKARLEAAAEVAKAEEMMRASSGNLEAREAAEEQLGWAKEATRFARRTEKAATTGTGLRTVVRVEVVAATELLDWAYTRDPKRFDDLALQMADEVARTGVRTIPGAVVHEDKVASTSRAA